MVQCKSVTQTKLTIRMRSSTHSPLSLKLPPPGSLTPTPNPYDWAPLFSLVHQIPNEGLQYTALGVAAKIEEGETTGSAPALKRFSLDGKTGWEEAIPQRGPLQGQVLSETIVTVTELSRKALKTI